MNLVMGGVLGWVIGVGFFPEFLWLASCVREGLPGTAVELSILNLLYPEPIIISTQIGSAKMSGNNNPFRQTEPIDEDNYFISIMEKLSQLKNKDKDTGKESLSHNTLTEKHKLPQPPDLNEFQTENAQQAKRELQPIIFPPASKKVNTNYQAREDSFSEQHQEPLKKGDVFENIENEDGLLNEKNPELRADDGLNDSPAIRVLRQKIAAKRRSIQELKGCIQRLEIKAEETKNSQNIVLANQQVIVMRMLNENYQRKIYYNGIKQMEEINSTKNQEAEYLSYLGDRLEIVKGEKVKRKKNRISDEESNFFMEDYGGERIVYLKEWKKKIQGEKNSIEKEISKRSSKAGSSRLSTDETSCYELPDIFLNSKSDRTLFLDHHFPLFSRKTINNLKDGEPYQIRAMEMEKFTYENINVIVFPKLMKLSKRKQLCQRFEFFYQNSKQLNKGKFNQILLPYTFLQIPQSEECIIIGRESWETDKAWSLREYLHHYEAFNELIAKYIVKFCLKAYCEIKNKIKHEPIILPENIIFNDRNDIRIDDWIINEAYRYAEYRENLKPEEKYLYFPPEWVSTLDYGMIGGTFGCWTIGVMFYEMIYGHKPFSYSINLKDSEEFFIMNEVEIPQKPQISDHAKHFLKSCLMRPEERLQLDKALKHEYFVLNK